MPPPCSFNFIPALRGLRKKEILMVIYVWKKVFFTNESNLHQKRKGHLRKLRWGRRNLKRKLFLTPAPRKWGWDIVFMFSHLGGKKRKMICQLKLCLLTLTGLGFGRIAGRLTRTLSNIWKGKPLKRRSLFYRLHFNNELKKYASRQVIWKYCNLELS